jgi:uncharacterized metal-binding protein
MDKKLPNCARCPHQPPERLCLREDGKAPDNCPTINHTEAIAYSLQEFAKPDILEFARQATIQEGEGYGDKDLGYQNIKPVKPRILETIEFAKKMKYQRLGMAFCLGLYKEARIVEKLFSSKGFEMISSLCKMGRVPKEEIGILDEQKIRIGSFESMCNPIAQAASLNTAKTEFNIVMGLCVGHDSLFLKYAEAPCTVLAVKDRLMGHNPLAAIYTIDSYYRSLK